MSINYWQQFERSICSTNSLFDNDYRLEPALNFDEDSHQYSNDQQMSLTPMEGLDIFTIPKGYCEDDYEDTPFTELNKSYEEEFNNKGTNFLTQILPKPKVFDIIKIKKIKNKEKKKLGRKRFCTSEEPTENKQKNEKTHDKYSSDNVNKKIKRILIEKVTSFVNNAMVEEIQLEETEKEDTFPKEKKRKRKFEFHQGLLLKITQEVSTNTTIEYNLELLTKTIREILSNDLCKKNEMYGLDRNRKLIEQIKGNPHRQKTNAILDATFLQCMEHFRGTKNDCESLIGLKKEYEKVIDELSLTEDEEYIDTFNKHLKEFEVSLAKKKAKKNKKISLINVGVNFNTNQFDSIKGI